MTDRQTDRQRKRSQRNLLEGKAKKEPGCRDPVERDKHGIP